MESLSHTQTLVLASQSPRRAAILDALGLSYRIAVSDAEEFNHYPAPILRRGMPQIAIAEDDHPAVRAWRKGNHIAQDHPDAVVLAADTIVVCDGIVLNKPIDTPDAIRMLQTLNGRSHDVYTGMALFVPGHLPVFHVETSTVTMRALSAAEITAYVATGEPMDKAGAYGIQGLAGSLVQAVVGSFTNVVGLPLAPTIQLLASAGIPCPQPLAAAYTRWRAAHPHLRSDLGSAP